MAIYQNLEYPVRGSIESEHELQLQSLTATGTWWNGEEKAYLAREARAVLADESSAQIKPKNSTNESRVLDAAKNVVHQIASGGNGITRKTLDRALDSGLSEEQYVETVGLASRTVCLDIFCEGLGIPRLEFKQPSDDEASKEIPETLADEGAWLKTIPSGAEGKNAGLNLYGKIPAPFIFRALSLVPDEARRVIALITTQYVPFEELMNFSFSHEESFGRPHVELVAGRTSAINECFY